MGSCRFEVQSIKQVVHSDGEPRITISSDTKHMRAPGSCHPKSVVEGRRHRIYISTLFFPWHGASDAPRASVNRASCPSLPPAASVSSPRRLGAIIKQTPHTCTAFPPSLRQLQQHPSRRPNPPGARRSVQQLQLVLACPRMNHRSPVTRGVRPRNHPQVNLPRSSQSSTRRPTRKPKRLKGLPLHAPPGLRQLRLGAQPQQRQAHPPVADPVARHLQVRPQAMVPRCRQRVVHMLLKQNEKRFQRAERAAAKRALGP
jgi:hypothetical protein